MSSLIGFRHSDICSKPVTSEIPDKTGGKRFQRSIDRGPMMEHHLTNHTTKCSPVIFNLQQKLTRGVEFAQDDEGVLPSSFSDGCCF